MDGDHKDRADERALQVYNATVILYRGMTEAAHGTPVIGPTARTLGVRVDGTDISIDGNNDVEPDQGGMSVAPDDPVNLPKHRRSPAFGGVGKDPVWKITTDKLGPTLKYVQDSPKHGTIQPIVKMSLADFQQALASTLLDWEKV